MTTVVDPAGTIDVINRDQATTVYQVAAAGTDHTGATPLTTYSTVNVVAVTADQDGRGVKLPAGEEGDFFELYTVSGFQVNVYNQAGSLVTNGGFKHIRYVNGAWRSLG